MQDIFLHLEHLRAVHVQLGHSHRPLGQHSVPHAQLDRMDPAQHLLHARCAILSVVFHNTPLQLETLHAQHALPALQQVYTEMDVAGAAQASVFHAVTKPFHKQRMN